MRDELRVNGGGKYSKPPDSVSRFDLAAPRKARSEYEKGIEALYKKSFDSAVAHLEKAVSIFPQYVSAHNALGTAFMNLNKNENARTEFQTATSLDDHLPYSYRNLGRAALALGDFPASIAALQKASSISPLDLKLRVLLAYVQLMNKDYPAVIATAQQVHEQKHDQASTVHYLAAAAWQAQHKLPEAQSELQLFLLETPDSPNAAQTRRVIAQMEEDKNHPAAAPVAVSFAANPSDPPAASGALPAPAQQALREFELQRQIAAADCETCPTTDSPGPVALDTTGASSTAKAARPTNRFTLRATVDEVGVFFAATDQGKAVSNLQAGEVHILDENEAPAAVLEFRNESQLPLRLGLVIDTSASITSRFSFERKAATEFLQRVVIDKDDLVFVVGFANSVLLVQDLTSDQKQISSGIQKLAPAGGTALWDAVTFAADKLASQHEPTPVARMLVVVSDGEDNSSTATLKQALESAERGDVTIYTVSTRADEGKLFATIGDRAMRALAQQTGGAAFFPDSLDHLNRSLNEIQQVIRGRYLVSYKPAGFTLDGRYRSIEIAAQKSGHKLRVYARKGYYARPN